MNTERVIGLDLGGTQIKALLLNRDGCVEATKVVDTEVEGGADHVVGQLQHAAELVCAAAGAPLDGVLGVGLGSPGPLSIARGVVLRAANLTGWTNVPLRDQLSERCQLPVTLLNDGSAACYGEFWCGAARSTGSVALLTFGTGVGGGVVMEGELVFGHHENATEFGHMIVHPGGRACRCGQRGCLEVYAGGSYMLDRAEATGVFTDGQPRDVQSIVQAAHAGQSEAVDIWRECCEAIAIMCVNLQHAFNPEVIVLGGGISDAGAALLDPVRAAHDRMTWTLADDAPRIEQAELGNSAGACGAAGWFLHLYDSGRLPRLGGVS